MTNILLFISTPANMGYLCAACSNYKPLISNYMTVQDTVIVLFTWLYNSLLINLLTLTFPGHWVSSKAMGFTRLAVMMSVTMIHLVSGNSSCVCVCVCSPIHAHLLPTTNTVWRTVLFFLYVYIFNVKCRGLLAIPYYIGLISVCFCKQ